ncbi:chitin deacetylase [Geranomyces michiganensis]|nr:chitin deacetylase [Geranomyces michiganensis]
MTRFAVRIAALSAVLVAASTVVSAQQTVGNPTVGAPIAAPPPPPPAVPTLPGAGGRPTAVPRPGGGAPAPAGPAPAPAPAPTPVTAPAAPVPAAPAAPVAAPAAPVVPGARVTVNAPWTNLQPQVAVPFPYDAASTAALAPAAVIAGYPDMPAATGNNWPDADEQKGQINLPALLNAPLVQNALALVTRTVSPALLNIPLSLRTNALGGVQYSSDALAATNCWWPAATGAGGHCTTPTTTGLPYLQPDISSCLNANVLGLNYDDGPSSTLQNGGNSSTETLAQQLATMNQNATFFVTGSSSYYNPQVLKDLYTAGHEIAVHSWSHAAMTSLTNPEIVAEIKYTEALIYSIIGRKPRYFRAPYGDIDDRVRAIAGALGYESVLWGQDKDSGDSGAASEASVVAQFMSWNKPQPGFIDLEHSLAANSNTWAIAALKYVQAQQAAGTFALTLMPVGQCRGKSAYVDLSGAALPNPPPQPLTITRVVPGATPTATQRFSTQTGVAAQATPTSGAARGVQAGAGAVAAIAAAAYLL